MDDSVDNASFSKMLNEDFTDSGMVAAFENFISQLKKSLWVMCALCVHCVWHFLIVYEILFITRVVVWISHLYFVPNNRFFFFFWSYLCVGASDLVKLFKYSEGKVTQCTDSVPTLELWLVVLVGMHQKYQNSLLEHRAVSLWCKTMQLFHYENQKSIQTALVD